MSATTYNRADLDAAVAAEREACAQVTASMLGDIESAHYLPSLRAALITDAIRARGDKPVAPRVTISKHTMPVTMSGDGVVTPVAPLTLSEAVGQMPSVMVSPAPLAPPYPGTTCDFCGVNVAPFTDPADDPKPVAHADAPAVKLNKEQGPISKLIEENRNLKAELELAWSDENDPLKADVERLTCERDEARAEVERLHGLYTKAQSEVERLRTEVTMATASDERP